MRTKTSIMTISDMERFKNGAIIDFSKPETVPSFWRAVDTPKPRADAPKDKAGKVIKDAPKQSGRNRQV